MNRTRPLKNRLIFRAIAIALAAAFFIQDFSYAALDLKLSELPFTPSNPHKIIVPDSVAHLGESWVSPSKNKHITLIEDAHTNESAQRNIARILEIVSSRSEASYVFLEGGSGDDSLTFFRNEAPIEGRKRAADSFMNKGLMDGAEYLDLTEDASIKLWGVEDKALYQRSRDIYRKITKERDTFTHYLKKVAQTISTLKPAVFNAALNDFDQKRQEYLSGKIALTDYFECLSLKVEQVSETLDYYPNLSLIRELKKIEDTLDFKKAQDEQERAVAAQALYPSKLTSKDAREARGFYAALEEKLKDQEREYPELFKYFSYLKLSSDLNASEALAEQKLLEEKIYSKLSKNDDERLLHAADENIRVLEGLASLALTPEQFRAYQEDSRGFDIVAIDAFLNRLIMEKQKYYERAVFLEPGYEKFISLCAEFYEMTKQRDDAMLSNILKKMTEENLSEAALIAGGHHSPNLKRLFRKNNISFSVISPQVSRETNIKKYESVLLGGQKPLPLIERPVDWQNYQMEAMLVVSSEGARLAENDISAFIQSERKKIKMPNDRRAHKKALSKILAEKVTMHGFSDNEGLLRMLSSMLDGSIRPLTLAELKARGFVPNTAEGDDDRVWYTDFDPTMGYGPEYAILKYDYVGFNDIFENSNHASDAAIEGIDTRRIPNEDVKIYLPTSQAKKTYLKAALRRAVKKNILTKERAQILSKKIYSLDDIEKMSKKNIKHILSGARLAGAESAVDTYLKDLERLHKLGILEGDVFYPAIGKDILPAAYAGRVFGVGQILEMDMPSFLRDILGWMRRHAWPIGGLDSSASNIEMNYLDVLHPERLEAYLADLAKRNIKFDTLYFKELSGWVNPNGREDRAEQLLKFVNTVSHEALKPGGHVILMGEADEAIADYLKDVLGYQEIEEASSPKKNESRTVFTMSEPEDEKSPFIRMSGGTAFVAGHLKVRVFQKPDGARLALTQEEAKVVEQHGSLGQGGMSRVKDVGLVGGKRAALVLPVIQASDVNIVEKFSRVVTMFLSQIEILEYIDRKRAAGENIHHLPIILSATQSKKRRQMIRVLKAIRTDLNHARIRRVNRKMGALKAFIGKDELFMLQERFQDMLPSTSKQMSLTRAITLYQERWTVRQKIELVERIARAMKEYLDLGIVHRDIKGDNIQMSIDPVTADVTGVVLFDLGLAVFSQGKLEAAIAEVGSQAFEATLLSRELEDKMRNGKLDMEVGTIGTFSLANAGNNKIKNDPKRDYLAFRLVLFKIFTGKAYHETAHGSMPDVRRLSELHSDLRKSGYSEPVRRALLEFFDMRENWGGTPNIKSLPDDFSETLRLVEKLKAAGARLAAVNPHEIKEVGDVHIHTRRRGKEYQVTLSSKTNGVFLEAQRVRHFEYQVSVDPNIIMFFLHTNDGQILRVHYDKREAGLSGRAAVRVVLYEEKGSQAIKFGLDQLQHIKMRRDGRSHTKIIIKDMAGRRILAGASGLESISSSDEQNIYFDKDESSQVNRVSSFDRYPNGIIFPKDRTPSFTDDHDAVTEILEKVNSEPSKPNHLVLVVAQEATGKGYIAQSIRKSILRTEPPRKVRIISTDNWLFDRYGGRRLTDIYLDKFELLGEAGLYNAIRRLSRGEEVYVPLFDSSNRKRERLEINTGTGTNWEFLSGRKLVLLTDIDESAAEEKSKDLARRLGREVSTKDLFVDIETKDLIERIQPANEIILIEGVMSLQDYRLKSLASYIIYLTASIERRVFNSVYRNQQDGRHKDLSIAQVTQELLERTASEGIPYTEPHSAIADKVIENDYVMSDRMENYLFGIDAVTNNAALLFSQIAILQKHRSMRSAQKLAEIAATHNDPRVSQEAKKTLNELIFSADLSRAVDATSSSKIKSVFRLINFQQNYFDLDFLPSDRRDRVNTRLRVQYSEAGAGLEGMQKIKKMVLSADSEVVLLDIDSDDAHLVKGFHVEREDGYANARLYVVLDDSLYQKKRLSGQTLQGRVGDVDWQYSPASTFIHEHPEFLEDMRLMPVTHKPLPQDALADGRNIVIVEKNQSVNSVLESYPGRAGKVAIVCTSDKAIPKKIDKDVLIVQVPMLLGASDPSEKGLLRRIASALDRGESITLDNHKTFRPVLMEDVARFVLELSSIEATGVHRLESDTAYSEYSLGLLFAEKYYERFPGQLPEGQTPASYALDRIKADSSSAHAAPGSSGAIIVRSGVEASLPVLAARASSYEQEKGWDRERGKLIESFFEAHEKADKASIERLEKELKDRDIRWVAIDWATLPQKDEIFERLTQGIEFPSEEMKSRARVAIEASILRMAPSHKGFVFFKRTSETFQPFTEAVSVSRHGSANDLTYMLTHGYHEMMGTYGPIHRIIIWDHMPMFKYLGDSNGRSVQQIRQGQRSTVNKVVDVDGRVYVEKIADPRKDGGHLERQARKMQRARSGLYPKIHAIGRDAKGDLVVRMEYLSGIMLGDVICRTFIYPLMPTAAERSPRTPSALSPFEMLWELAQYLKKGPLAPANPLPVDEDNLSRSAFGPAYEAIKQTSRMTSSAGSALKARVVRRRNSGSSKEIVDQLGLQTTIKIVEAVSRINPKLFEPPYLVTTQHGNLDLDKVIIDPFEYYSRGKARVVGLLDPEPDENGKDPLYDLSSLLEPIHSRRILDPTDYAYRMEMDEADISTVILTEDLDDDSSELEQLGRTIDSFDEQMRDLIFTKGKLKEQEKMRLMLYQGVRMLLQMPKETRSDKYDKFSIIFERATHHWFLLAAIAIGMSEGDARITPLKNAWDEVLKALAAGDKKRYAKSIGRLDLEINKILSSGARLAQTLPLEEEWKRLTPEAQSHVMEFKDQPHAPNRYWESDEILTPHRYNAHRYLILELASQIKKPHPGALSVAAFFRSVEAFNGKSLSGLVSNESNRGTGSLKEAVKRVKQKFHFDDTYSYPARPPIKPKWVEVYSDDKEVFEILSPFGFRGPERDVVSYAVTLGRRLAADEGLKQHFDVINKALSALVKKGNAAARSAMVWLNQNIIYQLLRRKAPRLLGITEVEDSLFSTLERAVEIWEPGRGGFFSYAQSALENKLSERKLRELRRVRREIRHRKAAEGKNRNKKSDEMFALTEEQWSQVFEPYFSILRNKSKKGRWLEILDRDIKIYLARLSGVDNGAIQKEYGFNSRQSASRAFNSIRRRLKPYKDRIREDALSLASQTLDEVGARLAEETSTLFINALGKSNKRLVLEEVFALSALLAEKDGITLLTQERLTRIISAEQASRVHVNLAHFDASKKVDAFLLTTALKDKDALFVEMMGVREDARKSGIGTAMLKKAAKQALRAKLRYVSLGVKIENTYAQAFYEKLGFEKRGTVLDEEKKPIGYFYQALATKIGGARLAGLENFRAKLAGLGAEESVLKELEHQYLSDGALVPIDSVLDRIRSQMEIVASGFPLQIENEGYLYHATSDVREIILRGETRGKLGLTRVPNQYGLYHFSSRAQYPGMLMVEASFFNEQLNAKKATIFFEGHSDKLMSIVDPYPELTTPVALENIREIWVGRDTYNELVAQAEFLPNLQSLLSQGKLKVVPGLNRHTSLGHAKRVIGQYLIERDLLTQIPLLEATSKNLEAFILSVYLAHKDKLQNELPLELVPGEPNRFYIKPVMREGRVEAVELVYASDGKTIYKTKTADIKTARVDLVRASAGLQELRGLSEIKAKAELGEAAAYTATVPVANSIPLSALGRIEDDAKFEAQASLLLADIVKISKEAKNREHSYYLEGALSKSRQLFLEKLIRDSKMEERIFLANAPEEFSGVLVKWIDVDNGVDVSAAENSRTLYLPISGISGEVYLAWFDALTESAALGRIAGKTFSEGAIQWESADKDDLQKVLGFHNGRSSGKLTSVSDLILLLTGQKELKRFSLSLAIAPIELEKLISGARLAWRQVAQSA